jgi:hypothetical protein
MRSRLLNPSTPDPRGKVAATATPTANQLNKSGGRLKRPPSAATVAKKANSFDETNGVELLDGTTISLIINPDWDKGFVTDRAKEKHTYHVERKFDMDSPESQANKRPSDNAPLLMVKTALVYGTPEYYAKKSKAAAVKRWQNLATAIGKGLADSSNKGVTIDDVANWILGQRTDRRWLFKRYDGNGVVFCKADDKGAVEWDDVPETQQKTIHKHLAAAKKRQGVDGESQYSGLDINTKIAQIEQMLADKYSDEALAKFPSEEYRTHMVEFRDLKKGELKRLIAKRDNQVAKALAKGAAGKGAGK